MAGCLWGWRLLASWAPRLQGSSVLQSALRAHPAGAFLQGTGKQVMSAGGEGHTARLDWDKGGVCCGQGREVFPDGKSTFTSVLYPPSLGGTWPAHHCSHLHQAPAVPVPPPCLCDQGQREVSPRAKDRLCHPRQAPEPRRSQQQGAHPWAQQQPPPTTVHPTLLPSQLPPFTLSH